MSAVYVVILFMTFKHKIQTFFSKYVFLYSLEIWLRLEAEEKWDYALHIQLKNGAAGAHSAQS